MALADFFDVSLDYLVYGQPNNTPVDPGPIARVRRAGPHGCPSAHQPALRADRPHESCSHDPHRRGRRGSSRLQISRLIVEGLIEITEILRVERHCLRADIVADNLEADIIVTGSDETAPGQFLPVVVDNLRQGCTYRFLLAGDLTTKSPIVSRLREMIGDTVGGDILHKYCLFRTTTWPVTGAPVLYKLDMSKFEKTDPELFAQFSKYLLDQTWLGYLNRPTDDSTTDVLMAPRHVAQARKAFDSLWKVSNA